MTCEITTTLQLATNVRNVEKTVPANVRIATRIRVLRTHFTTSTYSKVKVLPQLISVQATGNLQPIAVLNVNYDSSGGTPNLNIAAIDEVDDRFTRRFFFFDVVSG